MSQRQTVFREPFADFVQQQITLRERIHGRGFRDKQRTMDEINYLNAKTGWVRLMSGVDILDIKKQLIPSGSDLAEYATTSVIENVESSIQQLALGPYGIQELAYKFILSNGVQPTRESQLGVRDGLSFDKNNFNEEGKFKNWNNNSYGLGSSVQGLKPMPGITSATIRDYNNGALREATIKIQAWDIEQLQILELLYMRLGFTMYLEWGHTIYASGKAGLKGEPDEYSIETINGSNDPSLRSVIFPQPPFEQLSFNEILTKIQEQRKAYQGNYDGFLGRITNFNWTYNDSNESYDIELKMITVGSVIESLNMNTGADTSKSYKLPSQLRREVEEDDEEGNAKVQLENKYAEQGAKTNLGNFLWLGRQNCQGLRTNYPNYFKGTIQTGYGSYLTRKDVNKENFGPWYLVSSSRVDSGREGAVAAAVDTLGITLEEAQASAGIDRQNDFRTFIHIPHQYKQRGIPGYLFGIAPVDEELTYIRFGDLLQWLEKFNTNVVSANGQPDPITKIHYDLSSEVNQLYVYTPYIFSADPSICVVKNSFIIRRDITPEGYQEDPTKRIDETWSNPTKWADYYYYQQCELFLPQFSNPRRGYVYGRTMNIYLQIGFLMNCIDSSINEYQNGTVSVFDFLTKVCNGINESLGHVCHLFPWLDTETGTLYILNEYDNYEKPAPTSTLRTSGYIGDKKLDKNVAGTVKNLKVTTGLTKDVQNTIAIGAAAQAESLGQESTAFLTWHKGLQDRIIPQLTTTVLFDQSQEQRATKEAERIADLVDAYSLFAWEMTTTGGAGGSYLEKFYPIFDKELFETGKVILKDYIHITSAYLAKQQEKATPYNGFLPLNFSVTLDGISGIKIFQKFRLQSRILPTRYQTLFDTIVRNINHEIQGNEWNTTLDTFVVYDIDNTMDSKKFLRNEYPFYITIYKDIKVNIKINEPYYLSDKTTVVGDAKPLTNKQQLDNLQKILNAMYLNGFTKEEAVAICANMQAESGFNPNIGEIGNGTPRVVNGERFLLKGYGLVQWTNYIIEVNNRPYQDVVYYNGAATSRAYYDSTRLFPNHSFIYLLYNLPKYKNTYNTIETQVLFLSEQLSNRLKQQAKSAGIPFTEGDIPWNSWRKEAKAKSGNTSIGLTYAEQLTVVFLLKYERPGNSGTAVQATRRSYARNIWNDIQSGRLRWGSGN